MKRFIIITALCLVGQALWGQTYYDAETLGENTYYGTARSIAMGNAMTAVGGDLGSIGINPAGSAVAGYSQFTITPAISIATSKSSYSPVAGSPYTDNYNDRYTRFSMPNFGVSINFKTSNLSGIKNFTIGLVGNSTNNFMSTIYGGGMNSHTTMAGAYAVGADGYESSVLDGGNYNNFNDWRSMVAFRSGLISTYGGKTNEYIGVTEKHDPVSGQTGIAGPIDQYYGQRTYGSKYDYLFNFGMNINDVFYLGGNLGITGVNYQYDYYIKEYAQNPDDFTIEYADGTILKFDNSRYQYSLSNKASGVYLKGGFIWKPTEGLRIGAAIQTPTVIDITEENQHAAQVHYLEESSSEKSNINEWHYRLRTPWRWNAGIAYTFGGFGMISADYEMADYKSMKYKTDMEGSYGSNSDYDGVNRAIELFGGLQQTVRLGAEFKPTPEFSVRAGYNFFSNPETVMYDAVGAVTAVTYQDVYNGDMSNSEFYAWENSLSGKEKLSRNRHMVSLGIGWSSKGSFFADLTGRMTAFNNNYLSLYEDYITDASGNVTTYSPEILSTPKLWDVVLTLGWRF